LPPPACVVSGRPSHSWVRRNCTTRLLASMSTFFHCTLRARCLSQQKQGSCPSGRHWHIGLGCQTHPKDTHATTQAQHPPPQKTVAKLHRRPLTLLLTVSLLAHESPPDDRVSEHTLIRSVVVLAYVASGLSHTSAQTETRSCERHSISRRSTA